MGSSSKKKREKKQDFQKTKLKVGKTKPKASNFTDTSFRSKAIVIKEQSLHAVAPSNASQFSHQLSLISSRSDAQRRDALSYLTTTISTLPVSASLPQPVVVLLPKLLPLILDGSASVRSQLIRLLRALPSREVEGNEESILLYVRAGMTHLAVDIRSSAVEMLDWAMTSVGGPTIVGCAGGWGQMLSTFIAMLGLRSDNGTPTSKGWSKTAAQPNLGRLGSDERTLSRTLGVLSDLLRHGLTDEDEDDGDHDGASRGIAEVNGSTFPLRDFQSHRIPRGRVDPYQYLNLFGMPLDEDREAFEGIEERRRIFDARFRLAFEKGFEDLRKRGGEVGRAAASGRKILAESSQELPEP